MSRGVKFDVSLDIAQNEPARSLESSVLPSFVSDVQERQPSAPAPPAFPSLKSKTGFPAHAKRKIVSRSKQSSESVPKVSDPADGNAAGQSSDLASRAGISSEHEQIDLENQQRLAAMSEEEIAEARQEILSALDPGLLQRILRKSDIGSGSNEASNLNDVSAVTHISRQPLTAGANVSLDDLGDSDEEQVSAKPMQEPQGPTDTIHFPRAPQPPELDPSSSTFLEDLHTKYFPSLPADFDKLEWMRPDTTTSSYNPAQTGLKPGEIRFDFKGSLIPPSKALAIPVIQGLHHHGDAPDAAGYTIPELAHLSRSTYAPQRCIAFQTLGRILYKLGKGNFGDPGEAGADTVGVEDTFGELARGLWREIESEHVIQQLVAESEGNGVDGGRHVSAKAYATEAVWLWQRGGGRRWNTS